MPIIPQNRRWTQTNSGEVFGSLYSSYNVNFDQEGYLQISPKSVSIFSTGDDAQFGLPSSIYYSARVAGYFVLTDDKPFTVSTSLTISEISGAPQCSSFSDAIAWQDRNYVSVSTDLTYYDGSWTTGLETLTASVPHPLEVMGNFSGGHLVIGNGNTVLRLDTSHNLVATLTLNSEYQVTCMKYLQNNLYIGTRMNNGLGAKVFVWNGSGTAAQAEYDVGANWVFALEEYQSSIICVTSAGQLLLFTGGGFNPLANFPVYYSPYMWVDSALNTYRVHRRGLKVDGDLIYINIDGSVVLNDSSHYLPQQPSGVWCYDKNVGLYCRHLSTNDPLSTVTVSSLANDTLTLASSINAVTGEPVLIKGIGSLTGITVRHTYYVIKVSDTTIKLATSPANALAGTAITLGGTSGGATINVVGYTNYGRRYSNSADRPGALGIVVAGVGIIGVFQEILNTNIIWGFRDDSENTEYLNCLSTASNIGGFITNKVWSSQVQDTFQKIFVKYHNVNLEHEAIIIKSRSTEIFGLPTKAVDGTYSTQSVIGSDSSLLDQVAENNNINIISGNGAGQSVNIQEINGDEYTLDETISSASSADPVTFNVDNFKTSEQITDYNNDYIEVPIADSSSWVQIMGELRGQSVKIEELQLINDIHQQSQ